MSRCKNILITGGNRGIGLELVKQTLERLKPQNLIVTCREPSGASKELEELGSKCRNLQKVQLDVTKFDTYKDIAAKVEQITRGEGLNLMINNAGVLIDPPSQSSIRTLTRENLESHYEVNTYAPIFLTQAFLPLLEKASSKAGSAPLGIGKALVVNISSFLGSIEGNTNAKYFLEYSYRSSKTALNMLTKCMSLELKEQGILTVLIHPGWVQTNMGGKEAPLTVERSVSGILSVLESLRESDNGKFLQFDGKQLPW